MASLDEQTVCGGWENGCVTAKEVCLLFHKLLRTTKEMEASGVIGVDVIETRSEVGHRGGWWQKGTSVISLSIEMKVREGKALGGWW